MKINLSRRGLTTEPWAEIPDNVTVLIFTYNELTVLSPLIAELPKLEILFLGWNKLTSLPSEIGLSNRIELESFRWRSFLCL